MKTLGFHWYKSHARTRLRIALKGSEQIDGGLELWAEDPADRDLTPKSAAKALRALADAIERDARDAESMYDTAGFYALSRGAAALERDADERHDIAQVEGDPERYDEEDA